MEDLLIFNRNKKKMPYVQKELNDASFLSELLWSSGYDACLSHRRLGFDSEIYRQSAPNNSNETYTFMGLGRVGRFGQS